MTGTAIAQPVERSRRRWLDVRWLIAALIIAGAVGYLMYTSLQSTAASYFVTVSELQQRAAEVQGKRVRVGGQVVAGSIHTGGPGEPIRFAITDGQQTLPVVYSGVLPDIFTDGRQVIVEGVFRQGQPLEADTLLTQCPSKFQAQATPGQGQ
ncbi:cytochrome c maturation protein CcmE [Thermorudis peleae]|uniref:cytochrome c maturation protein CcmE n=1 Tax=Thermorudis peleae TaxID=1382356 RepID=UPI0005713467|nr:cytochrome c maturation protein CcmE [Thermorudis peleae]